MLGKYKKGDVYEEVAKNGVVKKFKVVEVEKIGFMTKTTIQRTV